MAPDFPAMLARCDAALVIGDPALFTDHRPLGADKIDLGAEWSAMTGLPFLWAFWAGRPGVASPDHVRALDAARDAGVAAAEGVARAYCPRDEQRRIGARYLRENIRFGLGEPEHDALRTYFQMARDLGIVTDAKPLRFFEESMTVSRHVV